jgi:hypothetical protein
MILIHWMSIPALVLIRFRKGLPCLI